MSKIYDNIVLLCRRGGITPESLFAKLKIRNGVYYSLRFKDQSYLPAVDTKKVCDYFNISSMELYGYTPIPGLNDDEDDDGQLEIEVQPPVEPGSPSPIDESPGGESEKSAQKESAKPPDRYQKLLSHRPELRELLDVAAAMDYDQVRNLTSDLLERRHISP